MDVADYCFPEAAAIPWKSELNTQLLVCSCLPVDCFLVLSYHHICIESNFTQPQPLRGQFSLGAQRLDFECVFCSFETTT
jgi:hypothetical protein